MVNPQWEYLVVEIFASHNEETHKTTYVIRENGNNVPNAGKGGKKWYGDPVFCLNYYGKKGWELIKMASDKPWFLFKRQMS